MSMHAVFKVVGIQFEKHQQVKKWLIHDENPKLSFYCQYDNTSTFKEHFIQRFVFSNHYQLNVDGRTTCRENIVC